MKTFSKRHPSVENPEFSFGPSPIKDSSMHLNNNKNVRFDVRAEAALAAHDYRVAHATRKAIRYTTELHKTFAVSIQNHTSFGLILKLNRLGVQS